MAKYLLFGSYCDDVLVRRAPFRNAHLTGLQQQKEQGILITIGPTKDNSKVFGIYEAENEEIVKKLVESDPYWENGIWTDYEIKEWIQAF
ncbi:MAG: YciI family protein [Cyanobacterium sp. T60_A2020_053]|nr:YciI family protein [Cyanobacterium sp. T60_A2020_053]